jgi:hypothetical protein
MTFEEFQFEVNSLLDEKCKGFGYLFPELAAESGEAISQYAKAIRHGDLDYMDALVTARSNNISTEDLGFYEGGVFYSNERIKKIALELFDVLFFIAAISEKFGYEFDDLVKPGLEKLRERQFNGYRS